MAAFEKLRTHQTTRAANDNQEFIRKSKATKVIGSCMQAPFLQSRLNWGLAVPHFFHNPKGIAKIAKCCKFKVPAI
jgi:hypothetical protein